MAAAASARAQARPIDTERSTLTILVHKTGLFSMFADDHVIRAPIADGSISVGSTAAVELHVRTAALTVLDPGLSGDKRAEVQARMLGPEVLDSAQYPGIAFSSSSIDSVGADQWTVMGQLTIRGVSRPTTFAVRLQDGRYRGSVVISQRDFGIRPISIVGGTVKVKDQLTVEFDIVPRK